MQCRTGPTTDSAPAGPGPSGTVPRPMLALIASLIVAGTLATAGTMKLAEPTASRVALATYGLAGRLAVPAWALLVVVELTLAGLLLAGTVDGAIGRPPAGRTGVMSAGATAGLAAAGLFALFGVAGGVALARGRGGAPCGCLGARGSLSAATVARAAVLALLGLLAAAPVLAPPARLDAALDPLSAAPGVALAGVALAALVAVLAALLLHRAPRGALDVGAEGPAIGSHLPGPTGLLLFTADGCGLCARVKRGLRGTAVTELEEERDAAAWLAAKVPGAPYAVFVAPDGTVLAKGAVNTGAQVRTLVPVAAADRPADSSRRTFLARGAGATATLTAATTVGRLVRPGAAEAYHFCGHIYTTDSCPHPTGLPRIDARGFPLRASDGHRVDDLGRPVDRDGHAVGEDGERLLDPDGRPLPRATRTRVCTATARAYKQDMQIDGAWYRCCKGHVRKLVDCCTEGNRRINGDKALTGYCYKGRKVFCVMFHQTKVPC